MPAFPRTRGPPVAVVGNGPVGQTTALLLARWGIPVIVLDARRAGCRRVRRRSASSATSSRCGRRVGAGRRIADEGVTWTTRADLLPATANCSASTFADRGSSPLPPFVNISQGRTEQILDERIAATPLIESRWAHEVVGLDQ